MGHWSSDKYSTNYKDKDGKEVNQHTSSPKREEYPLPTDEPTEDDEEPTEEEEEPVVAEEVEEEALVEEVDNITKTIPLGFAPMLRYKKHRLNPPSSNTIMEDEDDPSSE